MKFWNWDPETISHNLPSAQIISLKNHSTLKLSNSFLKKCRKLATIILIYCLGPNFVLSTFDIYCTVCFTVQEKKIFLSSISCKLFAKINFLNIGHFFTLIYVDKDMGKERRKCTRNINTIIFLQCYTTVLYTLNCSSMV